MSARTTRPTEPAPPSRRNIPAAAFALLLLLAPGTGRAQSTNAWTNTSGGNWSSATNWTNGAPISGTNSALQFTGSGTTNYTATNDFAGGFTLNQLLLNSSSTGTQRLAGNTILFTNNGANLPQLLQNNSGAFLINEAVVLGTNLTASGAGAGDVTLGGAISGAGNLVKLGAFTLILSGTNTHTGTNLVGAGVLNVRSSAALGGTGAGTVVSNGAMLELQNNLTISTETLTLAGTGITNAGALHNVSVSNNYNGALTLTAASRITADAGSTLTLNSATAIAGTGLTLSVGGAGTTIITSVIGTTTGGLIKDGTGTLRLNGNNTYTGATTISNGTLLLGANNIFAGGAINVSGGTLDITNRSDTVGAISLTNGSILGTSGTLSGTSFAMRSGLVTAQLGGSANLTKTTTNTVILSGNNSYSGGAVTISGGVLEVTSDAGLGNVGNTVTISGNATLRLNASYTWARSALVLTGGGGVVDVAGTNEIFMPTPFSAGTNPFTKAGTGVLELTNANARTGSNLITGGVLQIDNTLSLGTGTNFLFGGTFANGAIGNVSNAFVLAGGTLGGTLDAVASNRLFNGAVSIISNSAISVNDARTHTNGMDLLLRGVISGAGNVSVLGGPLPGLLFLTNEFNTHSGTWSLGSNVTLIATHTNDSALGNANYVLSNLAALSVRIGNTDGVTFTNVNTNFALPNGITIAGDAVLDARRPNIGAAAVTGNRTTFGNFGITNADLTVTGSNAYSLAFAGPATFNGAVSLTPFTATLSLDGAITETTPGTTLTKNGPNTLFITNVNDSTWSGGTIINNGALVAGGGTNTNTSAFATNVLGTGDITLNGGTLALRSETNQTFGPGAGYNVTAGFNPASNGVINVDRLIAGANNTLTLNNLTLGTNWFQASAANGYSLRFAGTTTFSNGTALISNSGPLILNGVVSDGGGGFALLKTAGGRLSLTNYQSNAWTGGTIIRAGQLQIAATNGTADNAPLGPGDVRLEGGQLELRFGYTNSARQKFGAGAGYDITVVSNGSTLNVDRLTNTATAGVAQFNTLTNLGVSLTVSAGNNTTYAVEFVSDVLLLSNTTLNVTAPGSDPTYGLQFAADMTGSGTLRKSGGGRLGYLGSNSPSYAGPVTIDQGFIGWKPTNNWTTTNVSYTFGVGPIGLDGGGQFALLLGANSTNFFANEFLALNSTARGGVTNQGGGVIAMLRQGANPQVIFSNRVTLAGPLTIAYLNTGNPVGEIFSGPLVLQDDDRLLRVINNSGDGGTGNRIQISGNLTNDGTARNLTLVADNRAFVELLGNNTGVSNVFIKASEFGNAGRIRFGNTNAFPSGTVTVGNGAYVSLNFEPRTNGLTNLAALAGKFNFLPGSGLALDATTNGGFVLNLGPAGLNQDVRIGVTEGTTRTNSQPITPFASTYKLGGGGGALVLNGTNQLTGANSLNVGAELFTVPIGHASAGGSVQITASNSFTGGTRVNPLQTLSVISGFTNRPLGTGDIHNYGTFTIANASVSLTDVAGRTNYNRVFIYPGSTFQLDNGAAVTNRFGDEETLTLNGATFQLLGRSGTAITETNAGLVVNLGSRVFVDGVNASLTQLSVTNLTRVGAGTLHLLRDATVASGEFGNAQRFAVTNAPAVSNGMVAPWIVNATDFSFLSYGTNGFSNAIYTTSNLNTALLGTDVVDVVVGTTSLTVNPTIYALRVAGSINTNPGADTITVTSGGVLASNNTLLNARLDFAGQEALVFVNGTLTNNQPFTNAATITKFGDGTLRFNVEQPDYTNGWTINRGTLQNVVPNGVVPVGGTNNAFGEAAAGNFLNLNGNDATLNFATAGTNMLLASGKITATERNIIVWDGQSSDVRHFFAPFGLELTALPGSPLGAVLRVDVGGGGRSRDVLEATGPLTLSSDATLNVRSTGIASLNTGGTNRLVFSGGLIGTNRTLTKMGNGVLEFSGDSSGTFSGGTIQVNAGTLSAGDNGAFGAGGTVVNFKSNTVFELNAALQSFTSTATVVQAPGSAERWLGVGRFTNLFISETVTLAAGVDFQIASQIYNTNTALKTVRLNGGTLGGYEFIDDSRSTAFSNNFNFVLLADEKIGQSGVDIGRSGVITRLDGTITESGGSRSVTKVGLDTLVLGSNNVWSGTTTIREGVLRLATTDALPAGTPLTIVGQATLDLGGFDQRVSSFTGSGLLTNSITTNTPSLRLNNSVSNLWRGYLGGSLGLIKDGAGDLTLAGSGNAGGSRQIINGAVYVSAETTNGQGPLGSPGATISLFDNFGAAYLLTTGPYTIPQSITINTFGTGGTKTIGGVTPHASTFSGTMTLLDALSVTVAPGGQVNLTGNISDGGFDSPSAITKVGTGILNLTGSNTLFGGVSVTEGTMLVNNASGTGTGFGPVYLYGGTTLGGSGRIGGPVQIYDGAFFKPGNSPGAMRVDQDLTLAGTATMTFEIGGLIATNEFDFVSVGGIANFGGTLELSLVNGYLPTTNATWNLMEFASKTGTYANATNNARVATTDHLGSFRVSYGTTNLTLNAFNYTDTGTDGIYDAWALKYFGVTNLAAGTGPTQRDGDFDNDGQSNYAEFLAGTIPTNAASFFHVTTVLLGGGANVAVRWTVPAETNFRTPAYEILYTTNFATWLTVSNPVVSNVPPSELQWMDDGSQTGGFAPLTLPKTRSYRVRVK
ncbi:MAG: autotransporter-associated beta strand repeat-containing protein [Verrucomicrobia bacterium]|nr:autotransporter-associated beta strand repeat-containing protein [Verrucomicrobiota bacterium]